MAPADTMTTLAFTLILYASDPLESMNVPLTPVAIPFSCVIESTRQLNMRYSQLYRRSTRHEYRLRAYFVWYHNDTLGGKNHTLHMN